MNKLSCLKVCAAALGASLALSAHAGEMSQKKGEPASVDESRPDMAGKDAKGKSGASTMPGKGPASVSESAPSKSGKEPVASGKGGDNKNLPNPKTPANVSESAPDKAGKSR
jgi:hypothetical protein